MSAYWIAPLVLVFLALLWGWLSSNIILHQPRLRNDFDPKAFGYDFEPFKTSTEDGVRLEGWFVPAKVKSEAAIILMHGWGANRADILPITIFLAQRYNLAYFDFRNHGNSGGGKTSLGCLEVKDFESVVKFLKAQKPAFIQKLAVHGFSMGAAAAITGAAKTPEIRAVVSESPFSSYQEVVYRYATRFFHAPRFIVPITFAFTRARLGFDPEPSSPIYHAKALAPRPLLIIQCGSDNRMPVEEGQRLYAAAGEPKELWLVPGADHIGAKDQNPGEYEKKILAFFAQHLG